LTLRIPSCSRRRRACRRTHRPGSRALDPDPDLERFLANVDARAEQLDDPRLLDREQLVPDGRELGEQDSDLALGNVFLAFRKSMAGTASR
jgi:hypothetical protein